MNTQPWIVFLRAINIGNRRIRMADLRAAYHDIGFGDVDTFLASGNVILRSDAHPDRAAVEGAVSARFGFDSEAFIRSGSELVDLLAVNPFDEGLVEVSFLQEAPHADVAAELEATVSPPEGLRVVGRDVFFLREGKGIETVHKESTTMSTLGQSTTRRGLRTVEQIVERFVVNA